MTLWMRVLWRSLGRFRLWIDLSICWVVRFRSAGQGPVCRPGIRRCGNGSLEVVWRFGRFSGAVFSFLPLEEWRRELWRHNSWQIPRGFIGKDAIVAVIMLDPNIERLGKLFETGFGFDNSFGVIVFVQVDVVDAAEVVNKDSGIVISC
ncbi:unnamed protein product [Cylindrotheca closterium]|uniref:Uncharacterized protein n=1 Tax=Cylindrotheca closterium TaxID=2856 RepID=A0AAD2FW95_9STRA|nr:unnamed protein product [Cylindrotheca closterium]